MQETESGAFYAVADGVSSCENSRQGAEIACRISAKVLLDDIDYYFDAVPEMTVGLILSNIRSRIGRVADEMRREGVSFASTLCFICINKKRKKMMSFVLGDSRIYAVRSGAVRQLNPVRTYDGNVTCTTMTAFAQEEVGFGITDRSPGETYLLCSDGCWRELFFADENARLVMREKDIDKLPAFFDGRKTGDDCSFVAVA